MNWYAGFESAVTENVPLAPKTWFNVGGPARYFVQPEDVAQAAAILLRLRENDIPIYVLGSGANLLISDAGVNGAVIHLQHSAFKTIEFQGRNVATGAGTDVQRLIRECVHKGLSGLECLAGIPGTVGGEIRMNAGGAFGDIGSQVLDVTVMDINGQSYTRQRDDLVFEYRHSNITAKLILAATFELMPDDPNRIAEKVKEIWMFKRNSQPLAENNAGCIFKNSNGTSAGQLIDKTGLKGLRIGGAEVSQRHANFIVAKPGCKAADIQALIGQVRKRVQEKFGIILETEVVIW